MDVTTNGVTEEQVPHVLDRKSQESSCVFGGSSPEDCRLKSFMIWRCFCRVGITRMSVDKKSGTPSTDSKGMVPGHGETETVYFADHEHL